MGKRIAGRDGTLDALRGVSIILVLTAHLTLLGFSPVGGSRAALLIQLAVGLFYKVVTQVAVPSFYLISLYLYSRKRAVAGPGYFLSRIKRLGAVFGAWVAVQYVAHWIFVGPAAITLRGITLGGPSLYGAEASVLYFLFDLILLVAGFELLVTMREAGHTRLVEAIAWIALVGSGVFFAWTDLAGILVDHWLMINFMPYLAFATLVFLCERKIPVWVSLALLAGGVAIDLIAVFRVPGWTIWSLSSYARLSVVGASLFTWQIIRPRLTVAPGWLGTAGALSLGIFAVHDFWKYALSGVLEPLVLSMRFGTVSANLPLAAAVLALTLTSVAILDRTPLRWMVR
ncbi:MAG: hypothetical protein Q7U89_01865 [Coriobacteriia bacterium]|nr:hypothetical protein [Coriobacteriia bacterium]